MLSAKTTTIKKTVTPKKKKASPPTCSPIITSPPALASGSLGNLARDGKATLFVLPKPAEECRIDLAITKLQGHEEMATMAVLVIGHLIDQCRDTLAILAGRAPQHLEESTGEKLYKIVLSGRGGGQ